ncbi:MAG: 16S rRNA (guanine(527)-N(7))-methyltransferase RsmG [Phycisphaerales bacterium]|nr:16S rRNA (guanine(527)-N(7))-methyltransferase RsmG [Phycisphaerales bacterium]
MPESSLPSPWLSPPPGFLPDCAALSIEFDPGDVERLGAFLALMLETNKTHNLTAITDPAEAWTKHILDAMTLVPLIGTMREEMHDTVGESDTPGDSASFRIIDLGSGGGVPAIPLAIVIPDTHFTLVEPTGKKAQFLRHAIKTLALSNVTVLNDRAERLGQDHRVHRERYDAATARALGHLAIVAELCVPLVRQGGFVFAIKGGKAEQELAEAGSAIGLLGARLSEIVMTPTGRVVVFEKASKTPRAYPRKDGEPKRKPLLMPLKPRPVAQAPEKGDPGIAPPPEES